MMPASHFPRPRTARPLHGRRRQLGVVAIEFALIFLFGLLPLLLLTFSGVLIFAAQQSLTLAAAEGARAALHYGTPTQRNTNACSAAQASMQWLSTFSGDVSPCTSGAISISALAPCPSTPAMQCMTVVASYNYNTHPFIPGTATIYQWVLQGAISSSATVQIDTSGD